MKNRILKINKPWGYELLLEKNKVYVLKKLFMKKGHRCSLQYHNKKIETVYVLSGKILLTLVKGKKTLHKTMKKNEFITIKKKQIHRMEAKLNSYYLEASSPNLKDVVRISDDYKR